MSDAELDRAVNTYYDKMYRDAYEQPEPHCKDCTHYCKSTGDCEQWDEIFEDYRYTKVKPDDDACDDFEADEYEPETEY